MKYILLLLLSLSIYNVLPGDAACSDASYDDRQNYTSDGWYLGDSYQDELNKLATEVDESFFPEFEACVPIKQQYERCIHMQTVRKASYDAFSEKRIQEARDNAKSVSAGMKWFGL
jgi:hypothetical protein